MGAEPNPDIARWNRKYAPARAVVPQVEAELSAYRANLPPSGLALEVACGRGANALGLVDWGYEVIACDLAINGLVQSRSASIAANARFMPLVCDLNHYAFPTNRFVLICVIRYLNRNLFANLIRWLQPGGILFYKTFNRAYLKHNPRFNPAYVVASGELNTAFDALEIFASDTGPNQRIATEPGNSFIIGKKPLVKA